MSIVLEPATTPATYRRSIPRVTAASPRNARRWAHALIAGLGLDPDTVDLAVSELATNVMRYAPGPAELALTIDDASIEVACTDRHPETAEDVQPGDAALDAATGRGLWMLAMLAADGVHVETAPRRKRVALRLPIGETQ